MNKIIVYERINFEGLSMEFTSDVASLGDENFNDRISSLKVIGNPWVAYTDINFSGYQYVYEEGEYKTLEYGSISSLQLLTEDLSNPQITLYENPDYQGRSIVLTCETNLLYGSFNDIASSHKVQGGAWVLYQHKDRGGAQMVARASQDVPQYGWFNDRLTHLRPLKPGKAVVNSEVLWDQKEENVKSVVIDTICSLNHGTRDQTFTTELTREYEGSVAESFNFSNSTEISLGTKIEVSVERFRAEQNLSVSNTFTAERGGSTTKTERKSIKISLPATIPPKTKLTVKVVRKEVSVKVPVKLTFTTASHSKVEYGEYSCQSGNSIIAEYNEEKI